MKKKTARLSLIVLLVMMGASTGWGSNVIQTQMSSDGKFEASVISARVRGEVLTFQVLFKNVSSARDSFGFNFADVYYTDIKAKKKYYGLKDTNGNFIAGPVHYWIGGGDFLQWMNPREKRIFWIKFPAPPQSTETVDLYIPYIMPFEGIKISR